MARRVTGSAAESYQTVRAAILAGRIGRDPDAAAAACAAGRLAVLDDPAFLELPAVPMRLVLLLARHAGPDGFAWPGARSLSARVGTSPSRLRRAFGELESVGFLETVHRGGGAGLSRIVRLPHFVETGYRTRPVPVPEDCGKPVGDLNTNKVQRSRIVPRKGSRIVPRKVGAFCTPESGEEIPESGSDARPRTPARARESAHTREAAALLVRLKDHHRTIPAADSLIRSFLKPDPGAWTDKARRTLELYGNRSGGGRW